jgi:photosystem I subunit XI
MAQVAERIDRSKDNPGDIRNNEVVRPIADSQYSDLLTPINSSPIVKTIMKNLSAYRSGASPLQRGLEVGVTHGYWLVGPFAKFNPLRDTSTGTLVALLSSIGLVIISTALIVLYAASHPPAPLAATATPKPADAFFSEQGWNKYALGFMGGGFLGAIVAYLILANVDVLGNFLNLAGGS